jgi:serine/threonine protein kinase
MERVFGPGSILLGKYRVESMLGQGGMGVVLKVTHLHLGEELAIKVLLPEAALNPDVAARFLREAQSAVRLRGEHVARVSDVGVLPEGLPFMVMDYLRGTDLCGELARRTTLPPGEAVDYILQACEALAEAHTHGIVHRDIKPANLFLTTRPDGTPLIKVLDFGISKSSVGATNALTRTEIVMGTPGYMSPEQMKATRDVDARTDIWALGIVLYECLGGRRPFNGDSYAAIVITASMEPPPPLNARIPRGLQAAVLRCLEKDRRGRFPSVAALAAALAPFARNQHEAATIVGRTNLLLQRSIDPSGSSGALAVFPPQDKEAPTTTLSGSAGALGSPPRRRGAIIGGVSVVGVAALISVAAMTASERSPNNEERRSGEIKQSAGERNAPGTITAASSDGQPASSGSKVTEAAPPAKSAEAKGEKVASCTELMAQKRWQDLRVCAAELNALGVDDSARRFRAIATAEAASEVTDRKARQALAAQDLKAAEEILKQMAPESTYHKALSEAFDQAEAIKINEAKSIVEVYLKGRDCAGLKLYLAQNATTTGTAHVLSIFNTAISGCVEKAQPAAVIHKKPDGLRDRAQPAQPAVVANVTPPNSGGANDDHGSGAHQSEPVASTAVNSEKPPESHSNGDDRQPPPASSESGRFRCDKIDVNDIIVQSNNLFNAGYAPSALALMNKVLECKQSIQMYRLAAMYACGAHDAQTAKRYLNKVPVEFHAAIAQKCMGEDIDLRGE